MSFVYCRLHHKKSFHRVFLHFQLLPSILFSHQGKDRNQYHFHFHNIHGKLISHSDHKKKLPEYFRFYIYTGFGIFWYVPRNFHIHQRYHGYILL